MKTSNRMCKNVKVFVERLFALGWQKRQIGCLRLELKRCRNAFVLAASNLHIRINDKNNTIGWRSGGGGWASNLVPIDLWFNFFKEKNRISENVFQNIMVEMIREAGWEGFMALWEKFQEAVASSAHTHTHKYSLKYFHLHTYKYKSARIQMFICTHTQIFICVHTQIFHLHFYNYSLKCLKKLFFSTALHKNKIWWIYRKSFGKTTKNDANDRTSKNID